MLYTNLDGRTLDGADVLDYGDQLDDTGLFEPYAGLCLHRGTGYHAGDLSEVRGDERGRGPAPYYARGGRERPAP